MQDEDFAMWHFAFNFSFPCNSWHRFDLAQSLRTFRLKFEYVRTEFYLSTFRFDFCLLVTYSGMVRKRLEFSHRLICCHFIQACRLNAPWEESRTADDCRIFGGSRSPEDGARSTAVDSAWRTARHPRPMGLSVWDVWLATTTYGDLTQPAQSITSVFSYTCAL